MQGGAAPCMRAPPKNNQSQQSIVSCLLRPNGYAPEVFSFMVWPQTAPSCFFGSKCSAQTLDRRHHAPLKLGGLVRHVPRCSCPMAAAGGIAVDAAADLILWGFFYLNLTLNLPKGQCRIWRASAPFSQKKKRVHKFLSL